MMELVDMRDLGSRASRRWGSSPHARTSVTQAIYCLRRIFLPKWKKISVARSYTIFSGVRCDVRENRNACIPDRICTGLDKHFVDSKENHQSVCEAFCALSCVTGYANSPQTIANIQKHETEHQDKECS
jgi:hypothetical protein